MQPGKGGRYGNNTRVASTVRCNQGEIKLKTTHEFVESQAAKAIVGQTIY